MIRLDSASPMSLGQYSAQSQIASQTQASQTGAVAGSDTPSQAQKPSQVLDDDDEISVVSDEVNRENSIMEIDEQDESEVYDVLPTRIVTPEVPRPRWGHTMTTIEGNRLLLFGGQTLANAIPSTLKDILIYDVKKKAWSKPVNCEGYSRQWHTATYLPERKILVCFGGESLNPKNGRTTPSDQVTCLDTEINLWYPPVVSGLVPSARSGHTATLIHTSNDLIIFGGVAKGNKFQNSVAVLDTASWRWSHPKINGDPPRPRTYHSTTFVPRPGGKSWLVIYGGNDRKTSFSSVHCLETDGKQWTWINPLVGGKGPSPRTGHCACLLDDKKTILIHGGWDPNMDGEDNIFQDSFLLDTTTWMWRAGPSRCVFEPDCCENVGGRIQDGGPRRVGHTASLIQADDGTAKVRIFGGRTGDASFANDFQTVATT